MSKRIHESLDRALAKHSLVFWYDDAGEWRAVFDSYEAPGVEKRLVENNEFGLKVEILRCDKKDRRYLVYIPSARPRDEENWLLDLLLSGYEYKADRVSLLLQEAGLPMDFHSLVADHLEFFSQRRLVEELCERRLPTDGAAELQLKMIAILTRTEPELESILLQLLGELDPGENTDPVAQYLGAAGLQGALWKAVAVAYGYRAETPGLKDFAASLFRGGDPLDTSVQSSPQERVFLKRWQDSQRYRESYCRWAEHFQKLLGVSLRLDEVQSIEEILEADVYPLYEMRVIHALCKQFEQGLTGDRLDQVIRARRTSIWYDRHHHGYETLRHAVALRDQLAVLDLTMSSVDDGIRQYTNTWWQCDLSYRRFWYHQRQYLQPNLTEGIAAWVSKAYVNNYLLPLADHFGDRVRELACWGSEVYPLQQRFFARYVQPFVDKGQKVCVIVSDALRYEVAMEFAQRLVREDRWSCDAEAMVGMLPAYTQLGMAALLPGNELAMEATGDVVRLDGVSTAGVQGRAEILSKYLDGQGTGIQAEQFMELNTKTEGRALLRDHQVIYIYHNRIDAIAHSMTTEAQAVEAVEETMEELMKILKKCANINANNMLLVADHGFLFQQEPLDSSDMAAMPATAESGKKDRRFVLGKGIEEMAGVKQFTAEQLGVTGDWSAAFPLALGRFPLKGSGKRFVHGGPTLQEVVLPMLSIHKARSSDTSQVNVDALRVPDKVTTGNVTFTLYQERAVDETWLPRALSIALYAKDGTLVSNIARRTFDSPQVEARLRETQVVLSLSRQGDAYNGQLIELRLEGTPAGMSQTVTYKTYVLKLQKPFQSDFDDF